ncbi:MAG: peptide chain release factor N(5)-glutamine methyltransferase [Lachnospiraceae bacterium]|nr:peptide chain release factor N(5)-glutamine methyltransferase [Lachnospiraceae bacterium]
MNEGTRAFEDAGIENAGIENAASDARFLMSAVVNMSHADILAHPERELSDEEEKLWLEYVSRRAKREPAAYITGKVEFMGLEFKVTDMTLIPGSDTETLVEEAMLHLHDGMRFLDLCTGTGCVAISLLRYSNDTHAVATDISGDALSVAAENAGKLGVSDRISLTETDLYPDVTKFDLIVSNPPYIPAGDIPGLMPEVSEYEPVIALDGGEDGLAFYRRIAEGAGDFLYSGGWLLCEIGYDQAEKAAAIFEAAGFKDISVVKDLGGLDRVVKGCFY